MKSMLIKKEQGVVKNRKFYREEIACKAENASKMRRAVSNYFGTLDAYACRW